MKVEIIPVDQVDQVWPLIADRIDTCLHSIKADCSTADLWSLCRSGNAFLMVAHDGDIHGAMVWRFETWLHGPVLKNLITVGDRMKDWLSDAHDAAGRLAKNGGATRYVWHGRKAWQRYFPKAKVLNITYSMEV